MFWKDKGKVINSRGGWEGSGRHQLHLKQSWQGVGGVPERWRRREHDLCCCGWDSKREPVAGLDCRRPAVHPSWPPGLMRPPRDPKEGLE